MKSLCTETLFWSQVPAVPSYEWKNARVQVYGIYVRVCVLITSSRILLVFSVHAYCFFSPIPTHVGEHTDTHTRVRMHTHTFDEHHATIIVLIMYN